MHHMSTTDNGPKNGSEALLDQLNTQGVDCVFASPIAVMAPIWEALSRRGGEEKPRYFRRRHELLAVSLASGYDKATGRRVSWPHIPLTEFSAISREKSCPAAATQPR
jgi:hypothetical protein